MRRYGVLLLALTFLMTSCSDGGDLRFDAPSEEELRGSIYTEPTATLDATTLPWAVEQTTHLVSFTNAFIALVLVYPQVLTPDVLFKSALSSESYALESSDGDLGVTRAALTYTASGYIDFSCPGANLNAPDYEFTSGKARLQSPEVEEVEDFAKLHSGALFRLSFKNGCEVGDDLLGGMVYGLFETPWVLAADLEDDRGDGAVSIRADIELAWNRYTAVLYDDEGGTYRFMITHPDGLVTSARIEGATGVCTFDLTRDLTTGGYILNDTAPACDFD